MNKCFNGIYKDKKVFLTGHTGFKGSWLALWLTQLGAHVTGYSLEPPTQPNHFDLLNLNINSCTGDVNDRDNLEKAVQACRPDIIFHMAAQSLVRYSYQQPQETFQTNVMGTVKVLEAARGIDSLRAIVNITSDKCYDNKEGDDGYCEDAPLGGSDPYSASKGCAELVTQAYRQSFFPVKDYGSLHRVLLASVRAGNVIGGGDWAADRLIPDIVRAINSNEVLRVRYPQASRPWQHVLEPLSAYFLLGQKLLEGQTACACAWNIGPAEDVAIKVGDIIKMVKGQWREFAVKESADKELLREADNLTLDCSKARRELKWHALWDTSTAVQKTIDWYKSYYEEGRVLSLEQLEEYAGQTG